jgi:hypothetical protein
LKKKCATNIKCASLLENNLCNQGLIMDKNCPHWSDGEHQFNTVDLHDTVSNKIYQRKTCFCGNTVKSRIEITDNPSNDILEYRPFTFKE